MNLGGHHRRAVGSAWQVGFGNIGRPPKYTITPAHKPLTDTIFIYIGGIVAVFAFLAKDEPKYIPGFSICIAFAILSIVACIVYGIGYVKQSIEGIHRPLLKASCSSLTSETMLTYILRF